MPYLRFGTMRLVPALLLAAVVSAMPAVASATEAVEIHYAPVENLEHIDVGLIDQAGDSLDMAAYILTDRPVIDALILTKERGVALRILLDPSQKSDLARLQPLADDIRFKRSGPIMHLKAYLLDGTRLRTGSANFTASGLKHQDNDLLVIGEPSAVAGFRSDFDRMWARAVPFSVARPSSGQSAE